MNYLERVNKLIEKKGTSIKEISEYLGINRNTVANYLSGKTAMPVSSLLKIAEFFDISVTEFFLDKEEKLSESQKSYYEQRLTEMREIIESKNETISYLKELYKRFSEGV